MSFMVKNDDVEVYLEECKYKIKKTKMTKLLNTQLESDLHSESELESDAK